MLGLLLQYVVFVICTRKECKSDPGFHQGNRRKLSSAGGPQHDFCPEEHSACLSGPVVPGSYSAAGQGEIRYPSLTEYKYYGFLPLVITPDAFVCSRRLWTNQVEAFPDRDI